MKLRSITLIAISAAMLAGCSTYDFSEGIAYERYADAYLSNNGGIIIGEIDLPAGDRFDEITDNSFIKVSDEPKSTFSTDADGAAYAYMRRMLSHHKCLPSPNSVRIEEYLNYFTFNYPDPVGGAKLAINAEIGPCPWAEGHKLLRLGLKGVSIPESEWPAANYVFLVDVSGSMDTEDKLPLLKKGVINMLEYMRDDDQIAIVTYSGEVKTLLKPTKVKNARAITNAVRKLNADGCTNGGQALKDAYDLAEEYFIKGGNNRIILGTDGDFNVGVTSTDALLEMVENYARKGIYMTVCGFGSGNLNDSMMETISNKGNGTYEYIDSEDEMVKVFVRERGRFVAVANDTKVQISFNPETVDSYRLIGYENRKMSNEDFTNDKKDAGEIGSGQTVTALYEIIPAEGYAQGKSCATFDVRYKKDLGEESTPLSLDVKAGAETMSANLSLAAGIASFGMLLRGSEFKGNSSYGLAGKLVGDSIESDADESRKQLLSLIDKASECDKRNANQ